MGRVAEATGGPILLEAVVRSLGSADESRIGHDETIRVELPSAVVGGIGPDTLGPIGAVDAALADEAFAVFLLSAPRERGATRRWCSTRTGASGGSG